MLLRNGRHWETAMLRLVLQALLVMYRYDTLRRKPFRDGSRSEQGCAGDRSTTVPFAVHGTLPIGASTS